MKAYRNGEGYYDPTAGKAIENTERGMKMLVDVRRGDIFYVNKIGENPKGSEQWADRPAVVVSNDKANQHSEIIEVVYLTGKSKTQLPTHVDVIAKIPSIALCEQITSISKKRLGEYVKSCTTKEMREIDKALAVSLGLEVEAQPEKQAKPATRSETGQNRTAADGEECSGTPGATRSDNELRMETERDLYKKLYEDTLERLIG